MLYTIRNRFLLSTALTLTLLPGLSEALPTGGSVSSGTATISSTSTTTTVNQNSSSAVINWTGFNTTSGQTVQFKDPSSSAITLNRVSGSATSFDGALSSNGNVWVINPSGIVIGSAGKINTAGFLATTSTITDSNFMAGKYNFTPGGGATGAVVNNGGTITLAGAGLASLVGPNVTNSGTIAAKAGNITLASGDTFTVDLAGDGLINLASGTAVAAQTLTNSGKLTNPGGSVVITAAQASKVVDNLINLNGVIEATSLTGSADTITYGAQYSNTVAKDGTFGLTSTTGNVTISGSAVIGSATAEVDPIAVSLSSTKGGNINFSSGAAINSNGGAVNLKTSGAGSSGVGSIAMNSANIDLDGGNAAVSTSGEISMINSSIDNGNTVSLTALGTNTNAPGNAGILLSSSDIIGTQGTLTLSGTATAPSGTGTTYGVYLYNGSLGSSGAISVTGLSGKTTESDAIGVDLNLSYINSTDKITILGKPSSASNSVTGGSSYGVSIINSTVSGEGYGVPISVTGYGGKSTNGASEGVLLSGTTEDNINTINSGTGGSIALAGYGGTGTNTRGIDIEGLSNIEFISHGSPSTVGTIQLTGTGGTSSAGASDNGIYFAASSNFDPFVEAGTVTLTGTGGSAIGANNGAGVYISSASIFGNTITLTGTGGTGSGSNNFGVELAGDTAFNVYTAMTITGTAHNGAYDVLANESGHDYTNTINLINSATLTYHLNGSGKDSLTDLTVNN